MTGKLRKPNAGIIIQSTALLLLAVAFWFFFVTGLITEHPTEESLVYEECTFEKYKKVKHERENNVIEENYYIYVEEYGRLLVIGNNVFDKTNEKALMGLKPGDKIKISIDYYADTNYLCAISCNGVDILSYEDYLADNTARNKDRTIIAFIFACVMTTVLVVGIVSYNKTGNIILVARRYHNPYPTRS